MDSETDQSLPFAKISLQEEYTFPSPISSISHVYRRAFFIMALSHSGLKQGNCYLMQPAALGTALHLKCRLRIFSARLLKAPTPTTSWRESWVLAQFWVEISTLQLLLYICLERMIQIFQNSIKKLIMFCAISSPDLQSWYLSIISAIFLRVKARIFCRK